MSGENSPLGSDPETEEEYQLLSGAPGDETNPIDLIANYLPGSDQWVAKTLLDGGDAKKLAALRVLPELIPEAQHHSPIIEEYLSEYMKAVTSEEGLSRQEYLRLLNSLAGGGKEVENDQTLLDKLLDPQGGDNNE